MIRFASFPLADIDSANEFVKEHPPRSTEKQSGVVFHDGNIVIVYDDGVENEKDLIGLIRSQIEGDKHKLVLVRHSKEQTEKGIEKVKEDMAEVHPKYISGMSNDEIREILGNGEKDYISATIVDKFKERMSHYETQLANLQNQTLMDNHEERRLTLSISAWEKQLQGYKL